MIIEFLEEAEQEFFGVACWYESKEAGLGVRFRNEISQVLENPIALERTRRRVPKSQLSCIPVQYSIFYQRE